jgi:hypothetical protein
MARFYRIGRFALTVLVALILIPVGGEFFIDLARRQGIYEHPSETAMAIMDKMIAVAELPWLKSIALLLTGLMIGLWIDSIIRHKNSLLPLGFGLPPDPIVKVWLHPHQALDQFVDHDLFLKYVNVHKITLELTRKHSVLMKELESKSTVDLEMLALKEKAPDYMALKERCTSAYQKQQAAEYTEHLHRDALMATFID